MRSRWTILVVTLAMLGFGRHVFAALPITDGLIYQLDATDAANIAYDASNNITSWASSQGSAAGFSLATPTNGAVTYSATGGGNNNLPNVVFSLGSKLVQTAGGTTTPKSVFIMENTTGVIRYGGIWGRNNRDRGIRFGDDNPGTGSIYGGPAVVGSNLYENLGPVVAGGTHQLINGVHITEDAINYGTPGFSLNPYTPYRKSIVTVMQDFGLNDQGTGQGGEYTENYYWSDTTIVDGRQTWQNKNWGTLGAYAYDLYPVATWQATGDGSVALGSYYQADTRKWAGAIGEVLVYDRYLDDVERRAVETYLQAKWLTSTPQYHPGDANGDGTVDLQDFGLLKDNFGLTEEATWGQGDFTGDGAIDLQDFGILKDHFGHTAGDNPITAVPEPIGLSLLALGGLGMLRRRRR